MYSFIMKQLVKFEHSGISADKPCIPYTCKQFVQTFCANSLTTAANGTSICGASLHLCSSYGVNFSTSTGNTLSFNYFFWITYFFSTFRYLSLYLFSNLAFCSFILFLLLYSVLVTHQSAGSDLFSSINSIKNCRSSAVPLEDITWSIVLQITTATTRCQLRVI